MIDTTFQTVDQNAERMADIELARSIVRTAESVLVDALQRNFPVGAHVRICVAAGPKHSYFTVARHTETPSKWMHLKNKNTGRESLHDMTSTMIDLVTYAYVVEDIDRGLATGATVVHSQDLEAEYRRTRKSDVAA
jgi:hypothetical protein